MGRPASPPKAMYSVYVRTVVAGAEGEGDGDSNRGSLCQSGQQSDQA
jgi:hypothetical protein